MTNTRKLYISHVWELSEFNSYMPGYKLADEEGMEEACYITLDKGDADAYFAMEREYLAWQERLKPLYVESQKRREAARAEQEDREELARLQSKYGPRTP